ncbi:NAD(P)/FAD-dependent oxidoreductase [Cellvibrio japonicus]|uniref:Putative pyridine nucleotide-disulphide oxidoreductase n=1 Tax=Cellvibrio japonicus (strain Ueda107) TaxID=498211 RepID=B3PHZ4_CELJU|nr:NAD(P)/FAD-dependent oxidoreductase [Cellvibrio japonicus]ACE83946.1 putative pyridine nucleotide-disulphide oxidoreductase [Cellvibrio japonicus Ueda107]QEI13929.1 NAD(P)/FAD-dependent oxidoreductase [Cellvibrio japonicus]QEI17503.1 NAD(P)/FAD-dependent oxidoreductase [Cellvibrio japonicus]QEI21079.1 NAD(P)/FAD-dependent oxidoreductase [Cellvibrio japonicus]
MATYDVIIIGGSYAGMATALQLARGRRQVLVLDTGIRRNRFATHSHGLLGQDGKSPEAIASDAKAQLLNYPNVTWRESAALAVEKTAAGKTGSGFSVTTTDQQTFSAKRLVLASGVRDQLPAIPGLQDRWGKSVFHCPYCHGYELNQGQLGVLAVGDVSLHQALLIPDWGPTTLFTNHCFTPDDAQQKQLAARGVRIETEAVSEIDGEHNAVVKLVNGRLIKLAGLFVAPLTTPASPIAQELGCELAESPMGFYVKTDEFKQTTVPGVFACGDLARPAGSVTFAIGDGALAGFAVHKSLIFEGVV